MHPFVIDSKGNLFVDVGTATNACDVENRMPNTKGHEPCTELETRGGIWRYDADKLDQKFSPAERYATGIRNGEGMDFDAAGQLFVTQHGRDQLLENYPKLYDDKSGHELPAEEVFLLEQGGDYGWPKCYFDGLQQKLVLAPEYGGDGGHTVGVCADKRGPAFFFPAHWAPNDLVIYKAHPVSDRLSRRRFHCVSWLVESCACSPRRLQRRLPAPLVRPVLRENSSSLRMASRAIFGSRDGPLRGPAGWPSAPTGRSTWLKMSTEGFGASLTPAPRTPRSKPLLPPPRRRTQATEST